MERIWLEGQNEVLQNVVNNFCLQKLSQQQMLEELWYGIFSGIPEWVEEDPEASIKEFLQKQLKLPMDTVKNISFHWVHCLGGKWADGWHPWTIVVEFEHFKQKELVRSQDRELRGTYFS